MPTTLMPTPTPTITGLVVTIEITDAITSELSEEDVANLTGTVADAFNVSKEEDVTHEVSYVTSGSLILDIPVGMEEYDVADAVTTSLATLLDVHSSDITLTSIDLESGLVEYEVASDSYSNASAVQSKMSSLTDTAIEDEIQKSLPSTDVEGSDVENEIEVDVTIVVDASDADDIGDAKAAVTDTFEDDGYSVTTDVAIVTSAPSVSPIFTSAIPTAAPSVTGIVVTLTLSSTEQTLNSSEITSLEVEIAEEYGVDADDVTVDATFTVSGSITLDDVPDDVSETELESILETSIADTLGVHDKAVDVSMDSTTGEVVYTITSDDITVVETATATLETETFVSELGDNLSTTLPETSITFVTVDDDITMDVVVTVDATDSIADITETNSKIVEEFEDDGFSIDSESINMNLYSVN